MVEPAIVSWLRWIALLPLLGAAIHAVALGVLRRPLPRPATLAVSCGASALSFVLAFIALLELTGLPAGQRLMVDEWFTWIAAGDFGSELSFLLDPLTSSMALVVTGVGIVLQVFSAGFMAEDTREDRGFERFFAYQGLLIASLLTLVLGGNLLVSMIGWAGAGVASTLMVGFWYGEAAHEQATRHAFVVGRIADLGFVLGTLVLFGSLAALGHTATSFPEIEVAFSSVVDRSLALPVWAGAERHLPEVIALCFLVAGLAQAAQFPFSGGLPGAAAAAPIPGFAFTSALVLGGAGVFLFGRLAFVFAEAPGVSIAAAWLGAAAALLGAVAAAAQDDIRKVLAFAVFSQLGLALLAVGVGAYSAAVFHVVVLAFIQALLVTASGAVVMALRGQTDLRQMGGLWDYLHRTKWPFALGVLALAGFPFLSGFYSQNGVLLAVRAAEHVPAADALLRIGLLTAALTAFYAARLQLLVFHGKVRVPAGLRSQLREPARVVLVPVYVLAFLAALGGFIGPTAALNPFPVEDAASDSFANFIRPVLGTPARVGDTGDAWFALGVMVLGAGAAVSAWFVYHRHPDYARTARERAPTMHRVATLQWWTTVTERGVGGVALALADRVGRRGVDEGVFDRGLLAATAGALRFLTLRIVRPLHSGHLQASVFWWALGAVAIAAYAVAAHWVPRGLP